MSSEEALAIIAHNHRAGASETIFKCDACGRGYAYFQQWDETVQVFVDRMYAHALSHGDVDPEWHVTYRV